MNFLDIILENEDGNDIVSQIRMGIEVEKEHTSDFIERVKIAIDHLKEDPYYYTKLKLLNL